MAVDASEFVPACPRAKGTETRRRCILIRMLRFGAGQVFARPATHHNPIVRTTTTTAGGSPRSLYSGATWGGTRGLLWEAFQAYVWRYSGASLGGTPELLCEALRGLLWDMLRGYVWMYSTATLGRGAALGGTSGLCWEVPQGYVGTYSEATLGGGPGLFW